MAPASSHCAAVTRGLLMVVAMPFLMRVPIKEHVGDVGRRRESFVVTGLLNDLCCHEG
jgi:hypothetical protein